MTEPREQKAQRLVDAGGVYIVFRNEVCIEGRVGRNEEGRAHHTFLYTKGGFNCTCDGRQFHGNSDDFCIHALALRLAVEKEE